MDRARGDPATAIAEADQWQAEVTGAERSYPQQCLGMAYTALLRWGAAERAFLEARDAAGAQAHFRRAQLAAMAGNAALAEARGAAALAALDLAAADAEASGDAGLQAVVQIDRARALVLQGDAAAAEIALAAARRLDPQSPYAWLLSATLARRQGRLDEAQGFIETAAALAPAYPEIGLEAGVIAMLDGREEAAAASWRSVVALEPDGDHAATARDYLAQLEQGAPAP
jgi:tetratricopeptide (TPR) repeat protein